MPALPLTDLEAAELEAATELDTGTLAERLAELAHHVAFTAHATAVDYRRLAALALVMARRLETEPAGSEP